MSELTVKDRNKRKSGDLSSEEESIVTNPEKKHEGSNTFFPEAAAAGAAMSTGCNSAPCTPTWPPRGGQNRPKATSSWLKAQQANEKIDGSTSTASGPNQLHAGAFKAPTKEDLMDVCEKMSQELGQNDQGGTGGTETFASKVKKAKRFFPYTVFVSGEKEDENLDKRHFVAFQEFIWQARKKLTFQENEQVKIEWMQFHGTCDDKVSAKWVRSKAQIFKFEEKSTRSYYQWERQESVVYGIFLKGPMLRQKQMKPNWALGQIFKANNLVGDFGNVSWDTKRNPGGVYLEFEPCGQDLILKLNGMSTLNCLTSKPTLSKRVRKAKTEEEFLAGLQKDPQFKAQNLSVHPNQASA